MKNFKIGTRLTMGFFSVLILMTFIVCVGVWGLHNVATASGELSYKTDIERDATLWLSNVKVNGERAFAMAITTNTKDEALFQKLMAETSQQITVLQKKIEAIPDLGAKEKELLVVLAQKRQEYVNIRNDVKKLSGSDGNAQARKLVMEKMIPARDAYTAVLEQFQKHVADSSRQMSEKIVYVYAFARMTLIGLGVAAILVGMFMAYILTKGITRPLNRAVLLAQTVASGDLTSHIEVTSKDETGQLMQALQDMNNSLYQSITQVRESAHTIASASTEIATGNQDLSSRTEEQASSLEETAASMEEITSTVRQNGDNAKQANQLAATASDIAIKGGTAVSQVVQTMDSINESSNKIVDIISVIDGIAFQTNILALNAAVEAARAGEQGRGFAVVATEVRSLSQRSATAARDIKLLIEDSVIKTQTGAKLVKDAGATMEEIVLSIRHVNEIMSEISLATQEQVTGIEQVNQAVTQMDTVSQQNAALVEEAAAAAESLQEQARNLVQVTSMFHTDRDDPVMKLNLDSSSAKKKIVKHASTSAIARLTSSAKRSPSSRSASQSSPIPASTDDGDWDEF